MAAHDDDHDLGLPHDLGRLLSRRTALTLLVAAATAGLAGCDYLPFVGRAEAEIVGKGLLTQEQWDTLSRYALALFARGQQMAAERGLILVDTKYEFGTDRHGVIKLADEIHTPDSSRYWIADSYEQAFAAGTRPASFDKDFVRAWVAERCDPYKDDIPEIPLTLIEETSKVYIRAYEAITGQAFVPDDGGETPKDRVRQNLRPYFTQG